MTRAENTGPPRKRTWYRGQPGTLLGLNGGWTPGAGYTCQASIPEERVAYRLEGFVLAVEAGDPRALPVAPGEKYVPLYEGRMVHQFDHCQKAYISGSGRRATVAGA